MDYEDILYDVRDHVATITINRPEVYNAFRGQTCEELIHAFGRAGYDRDVGAIVLTGAGDRAFCTGGDQSDHDGQYAGERGIIGMPIDEVHTVIRDVPKPVIAKVRGYAIGGGNVLATLCDLTIASENAIFGQVGPKMGSVDPGFGTAYLARVVGEKKAREMWYLCRRYTAAEALRDGPREQGRARTTSSTPRWRVVRGDRRAQPDRDRPRQALVQRRHRAHPRHRRPRHAGARRSTTTPTSRRRACDALQEKREPDFRGKR